MTPTREHHIVLLQHRLLEFCRSENWAGYDPYDGLNSRIFQALPLSHFKLARLAWIQGMKRSPVNLRPLLLVGKEQNAKGIALFLQASIVLRSLGVLHDNKSLHCLARRLEEHATLSGEQWGWGYNFDWQTRGILVPRGTPNIICTTFAANALLDCYEYGQDSKHLEMAIGAVRFLQNRLYSELDGSQACFRYTPVEHFRYTPVEHSAVHNANLLGAELLARVGKITADATMRSQAIRATRFSVAYQHEDGSWDYGTAKKQRWVDNFHTGFNLCSLARIGKDTQVIEFRDALQLGFDFYRSHFFARDGAPKYYKDRVYPIDIHSAAQSMITLTELSDLGADSESLAHGVLEWTLSHMWDQHGYFYFQKHQWGTIKIPYMRWSQAWMLLALATLEKARRN